MESVPVDLEMFHECLAAVAYTIIRMSGQNVTLREVADDYFNNFKKMASLAPKEP